MTRVKVFIDYQNVYHGARQAFGRGSEHPTFGHVRPLRLGVLLRQLGESVDPARELTGVAIFRGEPTARSHPTLQSASQKQIAAWRKAALVTATTRPLRHNPTAWDHTGRPTAWDKGEEKGIDVLLALDVALGAVRDEYDVAIIVSGDTDLVPALDEAANCGKIVENAVWQTRRRTGSTAAPLRSKAALVPPADSKAF